MYQLDYARCLIRPRKTDEILPKDFFLDQAELDMCKIQVDYDNELNPYNKGELLRIYMTENIKNTKTKYKY